MANEQEKIDNRYSPKSPLTERQCRLVQDFFPMALEVAENRCRILGITPKTAKSEEAQSNATTLLMKTVQQFDELGRLESDSGYSEDLRLKIIYGLKDIYRDEESRHKKERVITSKGDKKKQVSLCSEAGEWAADGTNLEAVISGFTELEKEVIRAMFVYDLKKNTEIGKLVGETPKSVAKIRKRLLERLRLRSGLVDQLTPPKLHKGPHGARPLTADRGDLKKTKRSSKELSA